jgi:hypothetical protein
MPDAGKRRLPLCCMAFTMVAMVHVPGSCACIQSTRYVLTCLTESHTASTNPCSLQLCVVPFVQHRAVSCSAATGCTHTCACLTCNMYTIQQPGYHTTPDALCICLNVLPWLQRCIIIINTAPDALPLGRRQLQELTRRCPALDSLAFVLCAARGADCLPLLP